MQINEGLTSKEELGGIWARFERGGSVDLEGYKAASKALDELFKDEGDEDEEVAEEAGPRGSVAEGQEATQVAEEKQEPVPGSSVVGPARPQLLELIRSGGGIGLDEDKARDAAMLELVAALAKEEQNLASKDEMEIEVRAASSLDRRRFTLECRHSGELC